MGLGAGEGAVNAAGGSNWRALLLLALPLSALGLLYFLPIANLLLMSGDWRSFQRVAMVPVHWEILANTFLFAGKVTLLTLLVAYPIAVVARLSGPRLATLVIACSTIPMWTSLLARTYAWLTILERRGLANTALQSAGLIERPLQLVHNSFGALVGSVYIMLPIMVLSLYAAMGAIDLGTLKAARTLGARPIQAFVRIFMPLSLPGVISGSLLVLILSLGFFVTPILLGGPRDRVFSTLIAQQINRAADFEAAAALALLFLSASVLVLALVAASVGLDRVAGGRRSSAHVRLARGHGAFATRLLHQAAPLVGWLERPLTWHLYIGLSLLFLLGPYLVLLALSVADTEYIALPTGALSGRWYAAVMADPRWTGAIVTSLVVGGGAALLAVALGVLAALGMRHLDGRLGRSLLVLFLIPAILPTMIYAIAAYFGAARINLVDTRLALIVAHAMLGLPFVVVLCGTALAGLNRFVEPAARSLGASPATTVRRVTLPLILPGMLTGLAIAFQTSFDEIVVSLFLSGTQTRTLPKALWQASTLEVTPIIPAVAVLLVAIMLCFAGLAYALARAVAVRQTAPGNGWRMMKSG